jgi:hypothetical protein
MPYYMKHEDHGIHVCYTLQDVEAHKLIGWVPVDMNQLVKDAENKNSEDAPKRLGRPRKVRDGDHNV